MSTTTVYVGNDRPDLTGVITVTGNPTVTGATLTLSAADSAGTKVIDAQSVTVDSVDDDADTINWTYRKQAGDYGTLGLFSVWLTVTYADGDKEDVPLEADGSKNLLQVSNPYD